MKSVKFAHGQKEKRFHNVSNPNSGRGALAVQLNDFASLSCLLHGSYIWLKAIDRWSRVLVHVIAIDKITIIIAIIIIIIITIIFCMAAKKYWKKYMPIKYDDYADLVFPLWVGKKHHVHGNGYVDYSHKGGTQIAATATVTTAATAASV